MEVLDPHLSRTHFSAVFGLIYDSLVRYQLDPKSGSFEVKPDLATSWEFTDPKTLVLKLRPGVKFQDGSPLDAEAARWSIDRVMTNKKSVGKDVVEAIQSVEAPDAGTLKVNLKAPSASILVMLSGGGAQNRTRILPKTAVETMGEDAFGRKPIGSGPFQVTEWVPDNFVTLKRFDGYWDKGEDGKALPYLDGVNYRFILDMTVTTTELKAGTVDVTHRIEPKDVPSIKANPNLVYWELPWAGDGLYLGLNARQGPFADNLKLRQAVAYAVDRESLVKTLGLGLGQPSYYYAQWMPGMLGYDASIPRYKYDAGRARQLLGEAGYPNGIDVGLMAFPPEIRRRNAELLKSMLDSASIRTTIEYIERLAWISKAQAFNFDMLTTGMSPSSDPDVASRNLMTKGFGNWTGQQDTETDRCMNDGRNTYDAKARAEAYRRCQQVIYQDAFVIPLWVMPGNIVFQKGVKGVTTEWDAPDVKYAWLDR